jgi:hypothetical protein
LRSNRELLEKEKSVNKWEMKFSALRRESKMGEANCEATAQHITNSSKKEQPMSNRVSK